MKTKLFKKSLSCIMAVTLSLNILAMESYDSLARNAFAQEIPSERYPEQDIIVGDLASDTEAAIIGEAEEERTENTKTFIRSDGSHIVALYETSVHYKDDNDEWQNIDNSLSFESALNKNDTDGYVNQEGSCKIKLAKTADSDKLVSIQNDEYSISWQLQPAITYVSVSDENILSQEVSADTAEPAKKNLLQLLRQLRLLPILQNRQRTYPKLKQTN